MSEASEDIFRITLLGTGAPPPSVDRFGPSTLVEVGREKFIFDAGRGAMQRLHQLGIPFSEITGIFLTHHHSDHVVGFPDLWLTGWIGRPWGKRCAPLSVWGPAGTKEMMEHLAKAFHVDIRVRSKSYPPDGVTLVAGEIIEGTVFAEDGIRVSAFKVDHGGEDLPSIMTLKRARRSPVAMAKAMGNMRAGRIFWYTRSLRLQEVRLKTQSS